MLQNSLKTLIETFYICSFYICLFIFSFCSSSELHDSHWIYWLLNKNLQSHNGDLQYDTLCFLNKWPPYLHSIFCIWLTCYLLLEACSNPNSHYSHLNLYVLELFNCIVCVIILHAILNESSCFFWFKQINHHIWFM